MELLTDPAGRRPETLSAARDLLDLLDRTRPRAPGGLVLDVSLPALTGLELQQRPASDRAHLPVVLIFGCGDDALVAAIGQAVARSRAARDEDPERRAVGDAYASPRRRGREVLARVVAGRLDKQVAADLGIGEVTAEAHRGEVMWRMRADTVADLVPMAARLGIQDAP